MSRRRSILKPWRFCARAFVWAYAFAAQASAAELPRLLPPSEGPDVNTLALESDGTRRIIAYGVRARVHPDGAMEVARQLFPLARSVQALELPARFGEGTLFWLIASGRTKFWRAPDFTSDLQPFAELDFEVERVVPGFDRLYFQSRRTGDWAALDASSGKGLTRGSLPASPSIGAMSFADEWFGAVELPVRGPVVSFDAGQSWHALGRTTQILGSDDGELLLATPEGRRRLAADGSLRSLEPTTGALSADGARVLRKIPEGPLGAAPFAAAVLHGSRSGRDEAMVAFDGALSRVSLRDGRLIESRADAVPRGSDCAPLRVGEGDGFACREPGGKSSIYALQKPFGLQLVERHDGARRIFASGNGGWVLSGACAGDQRSASRKDRACVRTATGARFEIAVEPSERVVALKSDALVLTPPDGKSPGAVRRAGSNGVGRAVPLKLEAVDHAARNILKGGFWLDAWIDGGDGSVHGWVASRSEFVGVQVTPEGVVRVGSVRRGIERTLLAGDRALIVPATGVAEQTVDGGATFTRVDLPPELPLEALKPGRTSALFEQGCTELGCAFAGWLRLGWDSKDGGESLPIASEPEPARLPQPGGGRWILRCSPTGEASAPALLNASSDSDEDNEKEARWPSFFEQPAPARSRAELGYQTSADGELFAYSWGSAGDFGRSGKFALTVLDPYRARGGVWSSAVSPSPWPDATQAAEAFGYEGSGSTAWHVVLDPTAHAGVLSVIARGSTDLFVVEENRRVTRLLENASRQGLGAVISAVRLGTSYYLATQEEQRAQRIFEVENGAARLVGQYSDLSQGRGVAPVLVRSVRGEALGMWTRGAGWFVFPIDPHSGAVAPAIEISARDLSHLPRVCAPDEDGYVLEGSVGIEPYVDFMDGAEHVAAHGYSGRFVVSASGVCVLALAAKADSALDPAMTPHTHATLKRSRRQNSASSASVPLVVLDRSERGKRWGFRCSD